MLKWLVLGPLQRKKGITIFFNVYVSHSVSTQVPLSMGFSGKNTGGVVIPSPEVLESTDDLFGQESDYYKDYFHWFQDCQTLDGGKV